ncbi:hypothetical protein OG455_32355 [Kitasatospora sp. NBC_01287]|uniref:hypothetical protein n=1 Tax=Kitasatospora sp. NBC_01287 TaxID=2903573 RepID=UPI00225222EC|nr:hypothetical protein [Kitasatospora sp. NBC_01287]MCX4750153.1 hypothetical protein [Kitasatospora sp. NBC_01287]
MADAADAALEPTRTAPAATPVPPPGPAAAPAAAARSGPWRWGAVAAACAALVAGTLAAAPGVAPHPAAAPATAPTGAGTPHALPAAQAPDPAQAQLPLDCGPMPTTVSVSFAADLGDGTPATVVAAHCQAGSGTAPDGLFVLGPGQDGHPALRATLLRWQEGFTVTRLALRSDGTITATAQGYSTVDVPRCCPDLNVQLDWTRTPGAGEDYRRTEHSAPTSTT